MKVIMLAVCLAVGVIVGSIMLRHFEPFESYTEGQELTLDMGYYGKHVRVANLDGVAGPLKHRNFGEFCSANNLIKAHVVRATFTEVLIKIDFSLSNSYLACGPGTLVVLGKGELTRAVERHESGRGEVTSFKKKIEKLLDLK